MNTKTKQTISCTVLPISGLRTPHSCNRRHTTAEFKSGKILAAWGQVNPLQVQFVTTDLDSLTASFGKA